MRNYLLILERESNKSRFLRIPWRKFLFALFFFAGFALNTQAQHDLSLLKSVDVDSAGVGDTVTFTISIINDADSSVNTVVVKDSLPANVTFIDSLPDKGSYDPTTHLWTVGNITTSAADDTIDLEIRVRIDAPGLVFNEAEIHSTAAGDYDVDSSPGDGDILDDDYASACVSVPFKICPAQEDTILLTAPLGYSNYQWSRNGTPIGGATSNTYKAYQAGEYTFTADTMSCSGGVCCPIIIEEACFDLALDKKLASGQSSIVSPGDTVDYTITVHNQGDYYVDSILITDYVPTGMTPIGWSGNDTLLTIADSQLPAGGLAPGPDSTISVNISLIIGSSVSADSLVNYAEISKGVDVSGTDSRDIDSNYDTNDTNNPGGLSNSPADDYIDGNGTGTPGDGVAATDADNHDPQVIYICPTITDPSPAVTVCSGDPVDTLYVVTTTADSISFVYFTTQQTGSDMYSGGTAIDTIPATNDTARITNVSFPVNNTTSPITYYVYAILHPTPSSASCRPSQEIQVTVAPQPAFTGRDTAICNGETIDLEDLLTGTLIGAVDYGTSFGTYPDTITTTVSPSITTTYYVRDSVEATGCVDTAQITITVTPQPAFTGRDTTICNGESIDLEDLLTGTLVGAVDYGTTFGTYSDTITTVVSPSVTTTYYVRDSVENATGCVDTAQITITVTPQPAFTGRDTTICNGETIDLEDLLTGTLVGAVDYGTTFGTYSDTITTTVSPSITTTYYVRDSVENATGCVDTAQITITVTPQPAFTGRDTAICNGETIDLEDLLTGTLIGAVDYGTTFGTYSDTITTVVSPSVTTTYYIRDSIENATGCVDTAQITITVRPLPTATLAVSDTTICSGESASIVISNTQLGVKYQLRNDGTDNNVGIAVPGNGGNITFTLMNLTTDSTFNILATDTTTGSMCAVELTDKGVITVVECDYGDLQDLTAGTGAGDYQTLEANNGPSHYIISGLNLGLTVDGENDGVSSGTATGDDTAGSPDDEDGVNIFPSLDIVPGGTIILPIEVLNTTGDTAHLEAWIDWNGDGDFDDPGEMVVNINDENNIGTFPTSVTIAVPTDATTGQALGVRFRLSNTDNMTPTGQITSGEVEDYIIGINCPANICLPVQTTVIKK